MNGTIHIVYSTMIILLLFICFAITGKFIYVNNKILLMEKIEIENQQKLEKAEQIYKEKIFQLKVDILLVEINCIKTKESRTKNKVVFPCVVTEQHHKNLKTLKNMEIHKTVYINRIMNVYED